MARKEDDKMDISRERLDENTRKTEARFTKQATAKTDQDGSLDTSKLDDSHQTDGGDHRF